jgi:hypothetical protein
MESLLLEASGTLFSACCCSLVSQMRLGNSSSDTLAETDSLRQTSPLSIIETTSHPSSVPPPLSMSPRGGTTTVTEPDGSAEFPGLSRWLAQLKRDPSTPQFHHESASHPAVMDAIGLKHSFVDNQDGDESACSITLDGSPLKRRSEFWQSLPVRMIIIVLTLRLSMHSGSDNLGTLIVRIDSTSRPTTSCPS